MLAPSAFVPDTTRQNFLVPLLSPVPEDSIAPRSRARAMTAEASHSRTLLIKLPLHGGPVPVEPRQYLRTSEMSLPGQCSAHERNTIL